MQQQKPIIKVKKPYDNYLNRLLNEDLININGRENRATALYFAREKNKTLQGIIGIKPQSQDKWILYRKKPYRQETTWTKHTWFRNLEK